MIYFQKLPQTFESDRVVVFKKTAFVIDMTRLAILLASDLDI